MVLMAPQALLAHKAQPVLMDLTGLMALLALLAPLALKAQPELMD
jgi:hypothetical protein